MPLVKKLTRIGNSTGLILPQAVLDQLNWETETEVELTVENSRLTVKPHRYASPEDFRAASKKVFKDRRRLMQRLAKK